MSLLAWMPPLTRKLFLDNEPAGVDASLDEILHTDETPALDVTVNSAGTTEHPLQPGEYTLFVNVLEKTTGNNIMRDNSFQYPLRILSLSSHSVIWIFPNGTLFFDFSRQTG